MSDALSRAISGMTERASQATKEVERLKAENKDLRDRLQSQQKLINALEWCTPHEFDSHYEIPIDEWDTVCARLSEVRKHQAPPEDKA